MNQPIIHGGKVIRYCRRLADLTQTQAGKKYGVSYVIVGRWERGTSEPSWTDTFNFCSMLGFNPTEVLEIALNLMKKG